MTPAFLEAGSPEAENAAQDALQSHSLGAVLDLRRWFGLVARRRRVADRQGGVRESPVDDPGTRIAAIRLLREIVGAPRSGRVHRARLAELRLRPQHEAAQKRAPRIRGRDLRRQVLIRREPRRHPGPQPHGEHPDLLDQLTDQPATSRCGCMAPGRRQIETVAQRPRDPRVKQLLAGGSVYGQAGVAVLLDQRMQAPDTAVLVDGQQNAVQLRPLHDAQAGIARPEHVVHQIRFDAVEDCNFEQGRADLGRQAGEQAHLDVVRHELLGVDARLASTCTHPDVAPDRQRDWPSSGPVLYRGQLAARQLTLEQQPDLGSREAKLLGTDDAAHAVQDMRGDVEPRVGSEGQGHVKIVRATLQQPVEPQDAAVRKHIDLVEDQQAGRRVVMHRPRQRAHLTRDGRRAPGIELMHHREIEPAALQGAENVAPEHVRGIVVVERQPPDDHSRASLPAADVAQYRGLAEAGRRPQYGEPTLQGSLYSLHQRGPMQVALSNLGNRHLRLQWPGPRGAVGGMGGHDGRSDSMSRGLQG